MVSTKDVLDHHLKSFSEGDLKGILSDYAPGAGERQDHGPVIHGQDHAQGLRH
jgi:hypothetical protein